MFHSPPPAMSFSVYSQFSHLKKKINILNQVKAGATQLRGTKQSQHQLNNWAKSLVAWIVNQKNTSQQDAEEMQ